MVFHAGKRNPCTWDVAGLSERLKIHSPSAPKVSQHLACMDHAIHLRIVICDDKI